MRKIITEWLGWLGVCVGCLSLISATTRILKIGLTGIFAEMIEFYREISKPLFDLVALLGFELSRFQVDMVLLYIVLLMMSVRAGVLPLLNKEILEMERARFATYYEKIDKVEDEKFPAGMVVGKELDDGQFEMRIRRDKPDWLLFLRAVIYALLLVPIVTFLPFRRCINASSISGLRRSWIALRLARSLSDDDKKKGFLESHGGTIYNTEYLTALKTYFTVSLQAASLPFATVLFFVLVKYAPK